MRGESFGRRAVSQRQPRRMMAGAAGNLPDFQDVAVGDAPYVAFDTAQYVSHDLSPEEELQAWKAERRRERLARFPWRSLLLMASLCFGIGSFMLPDSVNDAVDWVLWVLTAVCFVAGIARKGPPDTA